MGMGSPNRMRTGPLSIWESQMAAGTTVTSGRVAK